MARVTSLITSLSLTLPHGRDSPILLGAATSLPVKTGATFSYAPCRRLIMSPNPFNPLAHDDSPSSADDAPGSDDMDVLVEETPTPPSAPQTPAQPIPSSPPPNATSKGKARDNKRPVSPSNTTNDGPAKNKRREHSPRAAPFGDVRYTRLFLAPHSHTPQEEYARFEQAAEFARTQPSAPASRTPTPIASTSNTRHRSYAEAATANNSSDGHRSRPSSSHTNRTRSRAHERPRQPSPEFEPYIPPLEPRLTPTLPPPGGWRDVDGISVEGLLQHVDAAQCSAWRALPGRKILAWLARGRALPQDVTQSRLYDAICAILPEDSNVVVAPPIPDNNFAGAAPLACLVYDMSDIEYDLLSQMPVWSLPLPLDTTFFIVDFDAPPSPFTHSIKGLTYPPCERSGDLIAAQLGTDLYSNQQAADFLAVHHDALPHVHGRSRLQTVTRSIRCSPMRMLKPGSNNVWITQWNVFITSPSVSLTANLIWRELIANMEIRTVLFGVGLHVDESWSCAICQGISHPSGLCPFPTAPGWNGPAASSSSSDPRVTQTQSAPHIAVPGSASRRTDTGPATQHRSLPTPTSTGRNAGATRGGGNRGRGRARPAPRA